MPIAKTQISQSAYKLTVECRQSQAKQALFAVIPVRTIFILPSFRIDRVNVNL